MRARAGPHQIFRRARGPSSRERAAIIKAAWRAAWSSSIGRDAVGASLASTAAKSSQADQFQEGLGRLGERGRASRASSSSSTFSSPSSSNPGPSGVGSGAAARELLEHYS